MFDKITAILVNKGHIYNLNLYCVVQGAAAFGFPSYDKSQDKTNDAFGPLVVPVASCPREPVPTDKPNVKCVSIAVHFQFSIYICASANAPIDKPSRRIWSTSSSVTMRK